MAIDIPMVDLEPSPEEVEFIRFPKVPRLFRSPQQEKDNSPCVTVTEKIDGTNGCVVVTESGNVFAQSRNRFITPKDDNQGFAEWVFDNAAELSAFLGPGRHFGEWFGHKIMRGYGMVDRRFALFNTNRWGYHDEFESPVTALTVVPVIAELDDFDVKAIMEWGNVLKTHGSPISPGWTNPEGMMVYHHSSGHLFKVPFDRKCKECRRTDGHKMDCSHGR